MSEMANTIKMGKYGDIPYIKLTGRIISVDSRKFKRKMESLFLKKKNDRIIVNLSETEFLDSYGLGVIVYYHTCMQKAGRELIILNKNPNPQAYITRLLELTRLVNVFKVISHSSQM